MQFQFKNFIRMCFFLLLPALFAASSAQVLAAQVSSGPTDQKAIIQLEMERQQTAWNLGDVEGFMSGYKNSPETTFLGSSIRKGYQEILESYKRNYPTKAEMGVLHFSGIEVKLLGDNETAKYAMVTGSFQLDRTQHGPVTADKGVFSLLWEKTPEGWRIILDHTSETK